MLSSVTERSSHEKTSHHYYTARHRSCRILFWLLDKHPCLCRWRNTAGSTKKDLQLFKERVDMEKVYSSAIDDILSELKADGQPEHKMAATVIRGLKKDLIRELIRRTELKFQAKEVPDSSLMDKPLKSITAYIGSAALSMTDVLDVEEKDGLAFANIKLHDKKLDQDFLWRVQLEKDPNNKWTAVKIVNLKEYMKKRKELLKNQVEF